MISGFEKRRWKLDWSASRKPCWSSFPNLPAKETSALIQSLQNDLKQIREEHTQLIKTIELDTSAGNVARKEISPLTASQVQQKVLRPGQALLEYLVRDRETYLFLVTQQACKFYRLPIAQQELAAPY